VLEYLLSGILLGMAAGFAPGPLLILSVGETVKGNFRNGFLVALAPLITDLPIVLLSLFLIDKIADNHILLGIIYLMGGLFLAWLAFGDIRFESTPSAQVTGSQSLRKGITANFLNPQPYLWWLSIGAPFVLKAWRQDHVHAIVFVLAFYLLLLGSKIAIAFATHYFRGFMKSVVYKWIMRMLGLALLAFSVIFIIEGAQLLEIF
jgi:threonine/homoserine/homoserine lactone efflux protein